MDDSLIAKMRADFRVVAEDRLAAGDWSQKDVDEIGAAIKAAIEGKSDAAPLWARWLSDLAASTVALSAIIAASSARMRLEAAKQHQAAAEAAATGKGRRHG